MKLNLKQFCIGVLSAICSKHFAMGDEGMCAQEPEEYCEPEYGQRYYKPYYRQRYDYYGGARSYAMRKALWNAIDLMRMGRGGEIKFTMNFKIKKAKPPKMARC